ncbi:DUF4339 domain-containing protein [uncultured Akkermansia sp.]|uniref:DUF4339 domain-containing protein n=1 Tax=uncultured Akkermansia sp. TaxID=512294 RepID=UPI0026303FD8|nr:DUF4339 domain-containing protein [uncultured Akkermansia sp.]
MMTESDQTYYYASPDGQAAGPVSKRELRRLLEQGAIRESTSVLRKGENQWRRLSDFLPPRKDQAASIYYYASPDGQATGPVSERELRRLLEQDVIHQSTNVFRKGESQWIQLRHVLKSQGQPANDRTFFPPPLPPERKKEAPVSAEAGIARSMDMAEKIFNDLNTFIDKRLYSLFGFRKLVPYFSKWVNLSIHLTNVMTILASVLFAFAAASIFSAPRKSVYMNPYASFDTAQKAAEADGGMTGGAFITALGGGFILGILLQYVSNLFSRANANYFFGRKPVLSSMLLPRLNVILLCMALLAAVVSLFLAKGVFIILAILSLASLLYMIWLHLNCDRLFMEVTDKEASGPSDLIGYMMYQLRFCLIAAQTLIPVWLLGLCAFSCSTIFSDDKEGFLSSLLMDGGLSVSGIIGGVALLAAPMLLHLCYILAALVPELFLSILKGWKKA